MLQHQLSLGMPCRTLNEMDFILGSVVSCRPIKFEAMDTTGGEVKDTIEATNEEEAQQKIKQMGYFVTKLTEVAAARRRARRRRGRRKGKKSQVLTHRRRHHQAARAPSPGSSPTLQDAGLPVLRSLNILEGQMKPACSRTP